MCVGVLTSSAAVGMGVKTIAAVLCNFRSANGCFPIPIAHNNVIQLDYHKFWS